MLAVVERKDLQLIQHPDFKLDYVNGMFVCTYVVHTPVGRATTLFTAMPKVENNDLILQVLFANIRLPKLAFIFGEKIKSKIRDSWSKIGEQVIEQVNRKTKLPENLIEFYATETEGNIRIKIGAIIGYYEGLYPGLPYRPQKLKFEKDYIGITLEPRYGKE